MQQTKLRPQSGGRNNTPSTNMFMFCTVDTILSLPSMDSSGNTFSNTFESTTEHDEETIALVVGNGANTV